jgi:hypothetical protein
MKEEQDKKDEPVKPKSNSKLRQVWQKSGTTIGSTTTRGTTTKILIFKSKLRYSINETLQGAVPFEGLKTPNPR